MEQPQRVSAGSHPPIRPHPTILVVDNDEHFRTDVCRILRREGFSAVPARSGVEAPWFAGRPGTDCLIAGLLPCQPDGYHLGMILQELESRMPVIFTSRLPRSRCLARGYFSPRSPYLHQPFPPGECVRIVRRVLQTWQAPLLA